MATKDRENVADATSMICEVHKLRVCDWYNLGLRLNLEPSRLCYIEASYTQLSRRLAEVICEWVRQDKEFSWKKLGLALQDTPNHSEQGNAILRKYAPEALRPVLIDRSGGNSYEMPGHIQQDLSSTHYTLATNQHLDPLQYCGSVNSVQISPSPSVNSLLSSASCISSSYYPVIIKPTGERASLPSNHPLLPPNNQYTWSQTPPSNQSMLHSNQYPYTMTAQSMPLSNQSMLPSNQYPYMASQSIPPYNQTLPQSESTITTTDASLATGEVLKKQHFVRKEIHRLEKVFTDVYMKVVEIFIEENIELKKVIQFIQYAIPIQYGWHFLEEDLDNLEKSPNMEKLFLYLLKFMSYDNYYLLEKLVERFIQDQVGDLLENYITQYDEFIISCPLVEFALAYTEKRRSQGKEMWNRSPFQGNEIAVHFNSSWEQRSIHDLKQFQSREFEPYIPNMSLNMNHCEKRSIFVVWETTGIVVERLSCICTKRFWHLRTQGVLQLFIGNIEIDFTNQTPDLYENKILSMDIPLKFHCSNSDTCSFTTQSSLSKDSGIASTGATSLLSVEGITSVCDEGLIISSFTDFSGDGITVHKGDAVEVLSTKGSLAHVKLEDNTQGYIPRNVVLIKQQQNTTCKTPSICSSSSQQCVIMRTKVQTSQVVLKLEKKENISECIERPDTPPLEALIESQDVCLSDSANSRAIDPFQKMKVVLPPAPNVHIINEYPEVEWYQKRLTLKHNFLNLLKTLRPKRRSTVMSVYSYRTVHTDVKSVQSVGGITYQTVELNDVNNSCKVDI